MEHFQGPAIWKLSPIVSIHDTTFEIIFPTEILNVDELSGSLQHDTWELEISAPI
jgi:hypothetical protein